MNRKWFQAMMIVVAAAGAWLLMTGCEDVETDTGLTIRAACEECSGNLQVLGYGYGSITLTACRGACCGDCLDSSTNLVDRLFLPLEWSVSNPSLGRILASGGYTAVYESIGGKGRNIVTVRDQSGREGIAGIEQIVTNAPEATATTTP